ncbi:restriction endonuclease subunit S, partial [Bacteroides caecigallinarum]|nr:restriction endonuclease subunit S [Bacteroides caecigallinarum]
MENRYDKYKDSGIAWIGEIPEHWDKNKIIRLFSIIGSGTTPKSSKEDNYIGSVNWIQSGDINGGYIENCKNTISDTALKEYPTLKIYKAPFIIVAMYGASVGNISISNIDGCVNQACCVMNETKQNFKYLFYAMNSVKRYLIYKAEGGGQPNISQDKIKNTWMPIPPFEEQQSIATYLDQKCSEIDELITLQEEMITKLQSYKQSVITEAVTKGLDKNVPLKDSGIEWIGEIPEHWEVKRMKSIYNFGKGLNITKADLVDKGISVISYGQIHSKLNTGTCIKDSLIKYVPEIFLENNNASLVKKGDIIFADTSEDLEGCGNCIYIDRDMLLYAGYHTIIAKNISTYINRFLVHPTFRVMRQSCSAYSLNSKYRSSLNPYAVLFMTFILLLM